MHEQVSIHSKPGNIQQEKEICAAQTPASGFTIFSLLQQVCTFVLAETLEVIRQLYNIYSDLCEADHPQAQLQISGGKIQVQK